MWDSTQLGGGRTISLGLHSFGALLEQNLQQPVLLLRHGL